MKPGPPRLQKTADGKHREKGCVQLISPFVEKNTEVNCLICSEARLLLRYFVTLVYLREVKLDNRAPRKSRAPVTGFQEQDHLTCIRSNPSMTELLQDQRHFSEWKTSIFLILLHFFSQKFWKTLATFHWFPTEEANIRCWREMFLISSKEECAHHISLFTSLF